MDEEGRDTGSPMIEDMLTGRASNQSRGRMLKPMASMNEKDNQGDLLPLPRQITFRSVVGPKREDFGRQ